jgi:hypothetical protein
VVGNVQRWGQKLKENVVRVWLMRKRRIFFSRSRVGWCEFSARLFSTRVLAMLHAGQDLAFCGTITNALIGNNDARDILQPFEKFPEKSFGSLFVAPALYQDIQHAVYDFRSS